MTVDTTLDWERLALARDSTWADFWSSGEELGKMMVAAREGGVRTHRLPNRLRPGLTVPLLSGGYLQQAARDFILLPLSVSELCAEVNKLNLNLSL